MRKAETGSCFIASAISAVLGIALDEVHQVEQLRLVRVAARLPCGHAGFGATCRGRDSKCHWWQLMVVRCLDIAAKQLTTGPGPAGGREIRGWRRPSGGDVDGGEMTLDDLGVGRVAGIGTGRSAARGRELVDGSRSGRFGIGGQVQEQRDAVSPCRRLAGWSGESRLAELSGRTAGLVFQASGWRIQVSSRILVEVVGLSGLPSARPMTAN